MYQNIKNFLGYAVREKKKEVEKRKKNAPLKETESRARELKRKPGRFAQALKDAEPAALIAAIKIQDPSGKKLTERTHLECAKFFAKSEADAVAVVADKSFGGDISHVREIRSIVSQPILQLDFIIDPYQIYEAALLGADAVLFIAAALPAAKIKTYIETAKSVGLDHLVEAHTEKEIGRAVEAGADIVGINNQNLKTLQMDLKKTEELMQFVPSKKMVISESGINTREEAEDLVAVGARGMLIGTSIVSAENPEAKIRELKGIRAVF